MELELVHEVARIDTLAAPCRLSTDGLGRGGGGRGGRGSCRGRGCSRCGHRRRLGRSGSRVLRGGSEGLGASSRLLHWSNRNPTIIAAEGAPRAAVAQCLDKARCVEAMSAGLQPSPCIVWSHLGGRAKADGAGVINQGGGRCSKSIAVAAKLKSTAARCAHRCRRRPARRKGHRTTTVILPGWDWREG
eukprot:4923290-Prymnesium_polylepis.1